MPPFYGPRAMFLVTRYPLKTDVEPSSMLTGIETSIAFLHSPRTAMRFGSISKVVPTRRSCSRASSNGFSRRWDVVATAKGLLLCGCKRGKPDAVASLARCVRVKGQVPRVRHRRRPAGGRGDHRRVVGAEVERCRGRFGERCPQRRVRGDAADDRDSLPPDLRGRLAHALDER